MRTLSRRMLQTVVDSIDESVAVLDRSGAIHFVNKPWSEFGRSNGARPKKVATQNYLDTCDAAAMRGDVDAQKVSIGLRAIIDGKMDRFQYEYPCHSPDEQRWFILNATQMRGFVEPQIVVTHKNITNRKLAELEVQHLSQCDSLTQLANRRHFDSFLKHEWRARWRDQEPLALIMLDVDNFKQYNDFYGHLAGDACLQQIAAVLAEFGSRERDLAARYGGEEFALILGDSDLAGGKLVAEKILAAICALKLPHESASHSSIVTASIGVCSQIPLPNVDERMLIAGADDALYRAKEQGRNCVVAGDAANNPEFAAVG
ncbi:MAG: diguanylate cyclase domain-containing protein [Oceanococcus sp.]